MESLIGQVLEGEGRRFNPLLTAYLTDEELTARLESYLKDDGETY